MNKQISVNQSVQNITVTACNWHIQVTLTVQTVNKWQDDIGWWLEIIRLPDLLLPKKPQIIFTTNQRHNKQHINQ